MQRSSHAKAKRVRSLRALFVTLLALAAVGSVFAAIAFFPEKGKDVVPNDELDILWAGHYKNDRELWREELEDSDTAETYQRFVTDTQGKEFGVAHTLAHIMGELIYEKEGIDGVAFCDGSFGFGCYHSFFGKAISEYGIEVAKELDDACVRAWGPIGLGCPHGIGHGVQGYFGDDGLEKSLEVCGGLSWKGLIGGCSSGVFMEFNFHTMESLTGGLPRRFDPKNPAYPCDSVPERFAASCYFELPAWLHNATGGNHDESKKVCSSVPAGPARNACFKGIGTHVAESSGYDLDASRAACSGMPGQSEETLCMAGASWAFYAQPSMRSKSVAVCEGLLSEESKRCIEESDVIGYRNFEQ